MRVTNNYQSRILTGQSRESMSTIADLQAKIAAGKQVLTPADAPVSAGKSVLLNQSLGRMDQYQRNTTYAESRLVMEETMIGSMTDILVDLRELALQANNDTIGDAERQILLQQVVSSGDELHALINSKGPNGEYLFSGTDRLTEPFPNSDTPNPVTQSYQGNNSVQSVNIGPSNRITLGTSGQNLVTYEIHNAPKSVFNTLSDFKAALEAPASDRDREIFHDQMAEVIAELDAAQTHMVNERAGVGSMLKRIDSANGHNNAIRLLLQEELEQTEGLDYAETITRLESEIQSLEAVQATYARLRDISLFNYL